MRILDYYVNYSKRVLLKIFKLPETVHLTFYRFEQKRVRILIQNVKYPRPYTKSPQVMGWFVIFDHYDEYSKYFDFSNKYKNYLLGLDTYWAAWKQINKLSSEVSRWVLKYNLSIHPYYFGENSRRGNCLIKWRDILPQQKILTFPMYREKNMFLRNILSCSFVVFKLGVSSIEILYDIFFISTPVFNLKNQFWRSCRPIIWIKVRIKDKFSKGWFFSGSAFTNWRVLTIYRGTGMSVYINLKRKKFTAQLDWEHYMFQWINPTHQQAQILRVSKNKTIPGVPAPTGVSAHLRAGLNIGCTLFNSIVWERSCLIFFVPKCTCVNVI